MNKLLFLAMALTAIGLMSGCQKDPNANTQSQITFGNTSGMRFLTADSTIINHKTTYSLDLDHDGNADLMLTNEELGSPGMGYSNVATLKCLTSKVSLLGEIIEPIMYQHNEITIRHYYDPNYPQFDSICEIVNRFIQRYEPVTDSDLVITKPEKFAVFNNQSGDPFTIDDYYEKTDAIIKGGGCIYDNIPEYGTDTIYIYVHEILEDCDHLQTENETYIGFKLDKGGKTKLGWIKVMAKNLSGNVILLESAIQR